VDTLTRYLAVAASGAVGAVLRYYITLTGLARTAAPFPSATFVINVTGSFIIGFFLTLVTESINVNPHLRLAVAVGFVGAYTTFSTFEYETARLVEGREHLYAFLYAVLSFAVGFGAVYAGTVTARRVEHVPVTSHMTIDDVEEQSGAPAPGQTGGADREKKKPDAEDREVKRTSRAPRKGRDLT
jgi:fluoride exporter